GGALAVRTEGIYTIMITLAIGAAFYYFTNQNWPIFGGHTGINTVATPHFLGVNWRSDIPFYYLALGTAALCYLTVQYLSRAPFLGPSTFCPLLTLAPECLVKFGLDGHPFPLFIVPGFLAIVFSSSDGVRGLWESWRRRNARAPTGPNGNRHG